MHTKIRTLTTFKQHKSINKLLFPDEQRNGHAKNSQKKYIHQELLNEPHKSAQLLSQMFAGCKPYLRYKENHQIVNS